MSKKNIKISLNEDLYNRLKKTSSVKYKNDEASIASEDVLINKTLDDLISREEDIIYLNNMKQIIWEKLSSYAL